MAQTYELELNFVLGQLCALQQALLLLRQEMPQPDIPIRLIELVEQALACWKEVVGDGWSISEDDEGTILVNGRIPGCQSSAHTECYGELWKCVGCGKIVCFAEGTDDHPELCNDCWCRAFHPAAVA